MGIIQQLDYRIADNFEEQDLIARHLCGTLTRQYTTITLL